MPDTSVDLSRDTAFGTGNLPLPAGAFRGLKGDIAPIEFGPIIEMLDGSLSDQTVPAGHLYTGTITCTDVVAAPVFGTFPGFVITNFDFPGEVTEALSLFPDGPTRTPVPGSVYYVDASESIEVPAGDPRAAFRCYRPRLARVMVIEPWKLEYDEYEASAALTLKWRELPF